MHTLETDIEIGADGSLKLLSPLPAWLEPGLAHVLLVVAEQKDLNGLNATMRTKAPKIASPEMIAQRKLAFEEVRNLDPYREMEEPSEWQREIRQDSPLPFRN